MLDQNKLTEASALKEIINRTGRLIGIGLILREAIAHTTKQKAMAKNASVKSIGKLRSSGKFLYLPANRKSTKLASMEEMSAKLGKIRE
jgi:hypothetical protein